MKRLLMLSLLTLFASAQAQQNPVTTDNFLLTDREVYFVGPPTSLLGTTVSMAKWSPSGRHLIAQQATLPHSPRDLKAVFFPTEPPQMSVSVQLVDVSTGERRNLFQYRPSELRLADIGWSSDGETAFFVTEQMVQDERSVQVSAVTVSNGEVRGFAPWGDKKLWRAEFFESPDLQTNILVAQFSSETKSVDSGKVYIFQGSRAVEAPLDSNDHSFPQVFWSRDGGPFLQIWRHNVQDDTMKQVFKLIPTQGGTLTEVREPSPEPAELPIAAHVVKNLLASNQEIGHAPVDAGWLKAAKTQKEVLVAANASWVELSPAREHVAYIAEGALFVRPLLHMEMAEYQRLQSEEARMAAMNKAKQVGMAAMMFASDNGDRIPGARDFIEKLGPYMKDADLMKNFVWTYPGGDISQMENPFQVELGYIALPGGRCVLYADTHIKWIPDK
jgi:hypothetical protein